MNYDLFPATDIDGFLLQTWDKIIEKAGEILQEKTLVVDYYVGADENEILSEFAKLNPDLLIDTRRLFKSESEIIQMTKRFITDDALFGYVTNLQMSDYFDDGKLQTTRQEIQNCSGKIIITGCGAALVTSENVCLIYADMARWEIQKRFAEHSATSLGVDNSGEDVSLQYKRGYFNDWRICDAHKDSFFRKIDFFLDTNCRKNPKLTDRETFFKGIEKTIKKPFRVAPFFAPAPWGGQFMKRTFGLPEDEKNYGWGFDCVPEENSLLLKINGTLFELPAMNLTLLKSRELLGEAVEARFGKQFPIRFDMLDTVEGGNLSFQVHPTTQFIQQNFGMHYTQDESYYLLHTEEKASVFIGLKNNIDREKMIADLHSAQRGETMFEPEKYANRIPAKRHDHFLIPGGTVHCSGEGGLVLEISSTPSIFTFKMWDWGRLGLDGKPRPINIERGVEVIDWKRDTDYTKKNLVNAITPVCRENGWCEEKTGLHPNEFIETRRHYFSEKIEHFTNGSLNVLNLAEGEEVIVESPENAFEPFVVHYAETFIVPENVKHYSIRPYGLSEGRRCITVKASVRI
ncbi:MAG: class I mannose-6-phosphate isomerase [Prevotellaceae bacterium]|jgi:mannose-6-phosphate isomerase class I|nr:class I mannose-6-phosphate isomerase [Prevotellaceae bacterium]